MSEYEFFSVYGFHVLYPSTSKIELNPRSERNRGDVAFRLDDETVIFISWGPLEEVRKRYSSTEEHAKSALRTIERTRGVKKMELLEHKIIDINEHKVSFNLVSIYGLWRGHFRASEKKVCSVHIHCEESGRYFVIYGNVAQTQESMEVFNRMVSSFKCHSHKTN